jgi:protein phosphatase
VTLHRLEVGSRTHVGRIRTRNEDAYAAMPDQGVVIVADGMGGHRGGQRASRLAVDTALEVLLAVQRADRVDDLQSLARVGKSIELANAAVARAAAREPALAGMGTTLVVALFRDQHVFYAHVGDSRLYRWRGGQLRQLTRDHSLIQQLVDQGVFADRAQAYAAGVGDNVLVRSLGMETQVEPDVGDAPLEPGDLFLLCTDGLAGKVPDETIAAALSDPQATLESRAGALLQAALDAGGSDNVTLVLARPLEP